MRVSLSQPSPPSRRTARPLLDPAAARVVLGCAPSGALAAPIVPSAATLFAPRGVCLCGDAGPLLVSDTGHHRLLIWTRLPRHDDTPADLVIGQPDFVSEGRNARGPTGPATLNVPTGVAFGAGVLAVADAWNHRVLLWRGVPRHSNQPADIVLGQADFVSGDANRGLAAPRADTLNWCYGVTIFDGAVFVADTGNRRVLIWNRMPAANGAAADLVLGQRDFHTRDESSGGDLRAGMRWPHAFAVAADTCFVADAGSSRIMAWRQRPQRHGAPCDFVLGQKGFGSTGHNRGAAEPTAATLNMPYGLAWHDGRLIVADTANSRLLGFDPTAIATGAATALAGQENFGDKGENRWQSPVRDSLCWPYSIAASGDTVAVADTGNNRVLLWWRDDERGQGPPQPSV